jgi:hypothetical protein
MRGVMSAVMPCIAGASSSSQTSITLANWRIAGTKRAGDMLSTKNCLPSPATAGAAIQCSYTMQNLDLANPVTGFTVSNTIPDPLASPADECAGTVPSVTLNIPCFLLDPITGLPTTTQVNTLQPEGTIDPVTGIHTDTCGGILNETAPPCQTGNCNFTDRVDGTGVMASGSSGGVVQVLACTPTLTPTPTPTATPTPTPRIARPPCPNPSCEEHRPPLPPIPTRRPIPTPHRTN